MQNSSLSRANSFSDLVSKLDEMKKTPASLRGHIVSVHFSPHILLGIGVPRYDIGICRYREIELGWVVRKAYERLEISDSELEGEIDKEKDRFLPFGRTVEDYRKMLVKKLKYIEMHGLAIIDWSRVKKSYEGANSIIVKIVSDTTDSSFFDTLATLEDLANNRPTNL